MVKKTPPSTMPPVIVNLGGQYETVSAKPRALAELPVMLSAGASLGEADVALNSDELNRRLQRDQLAGSALFAPVSLYGDQPLTASPTPSKPAAPRRR